MWSHQTIMNPLFPNGSSLFILCFWSLLWIDCYLMDQTFLSPLYIAKKIQKILFSFSLLLLASFCYFPCTLGETLEREIIWSIHLLFLDYICFVSYYFISNSLIFIPFRYLVLSLGDEFMVFLEKWSNKKHVCFLKCF